MVIEPSAVPPDKEARQTLKGTISRLSPKISGVAHFVPGEGFSATVGRSAIGLTNLLAMPTHPYIVAAEDKDAAKWLAPAMSGQKNAPNPTQLGMGRLYSQFRRCVRPCLRRVDGRREREEIWRRLSFLSQIFLPHLIQRGIPCLVR